MQQAYNEAMKRLSEFGKEVQKTNLYKDAIKKQERVITKLESLLEKTLKDTQKARDGMLELEKLRTENLGLQHSLQKGGGGRGPLTDGSSNENERLNRDVNLLENLVSELRAELKNKRPQTSGGNTNDWEDEKIEMEVRLQKANIRINATQNELTSSA